MANIVHSREGVTQGDPLDIVSYGVGVLPLIKHHKSMQPNVTQPWYAEHAGALGTFDNLEQYFKSLKINFPDRGYYPNPIKIILVVHPKNLEAE